jgi:hypothetical protein
MGMLGGRNYHCIEIINLLVKIAKINGCPRILAPWETGSSIEVLLVYITKSNNLLIPTPCHMTATTPPDPNQSDGKFPIGRFGMSDGGKSSYCGCYGGSSDKSSST